MCNINTYSEKAPKNHATSESIYGTGDAYTYGHVKLSDSYTSSIGKAIDSIGASQYAVYQAYSFAYAELKRLMGGGSNSTDILQGGIVSVSFSNVSYCDVNFSSFIPSGYKISSANFFAIGHFCTNSGVASVAWLIRKSDTTLQLGCTANLNGSYNVSLLVRLTK